MSYSLQDAKTEIYDSVLHRQTGKAPEDTPVLLDEFTIEKPWGWIFFYNNERYRQTGELRWEWVGPGPIFFNCNTGEIRQFGSGCNLDDELYDYEMELAAKDRAWCLWLTAEQERKQLILKLKNAFAITTQDAVTMVPALPHCLFFGLRRHLDWVARHLSDQGVATRIELETAPHTAQFGFTLPDQMINLSLAQAYHKRWDVP